MPVKMSHVNEWGYIWLLALRNPAMQNCHLAIKRKKKASGSSSIIPWTTVNCLFTVLWKESYRLEWAKQLTFECICHQFETRLRSFRLYWQVHLTCSLPPSDLHWPPSRLHHPASSYFAFPSHWLLSTEWVLAPAAFYNYHWKLPYMMFLSRPTSKNDGFWKNAPNRHTHHY